MCAPYVIEQTLGSLTRRDALRLGALSAVARVAGGLAETADRVKSPSSLKEPTHPTFRFNGPDHVEFQSLQTLTYSHILDLTHTLSPEFPVFPLPGSFAFKQTAIATYEAKGFFANRWEMMDHTGTHIDAPNHFVPSGRSLDALTIDNFLIPVVLIDIVTRANKFADTVVSIDDIRSWEKEHGKIPSRAAVFMSSGWEHKVQDPHAYLNMDSSGTLHFPGFGLDAIQFLVTEREISGVAVDTISFDPGHDKEFRGHRALLGAGKWGIENVKNLHRIPRSGAFVFLGATKVAGASGGPVRLIALW